jgi:hypothetical protein
MSIWIRGAMVARLTPDQKVACSIHVGFIFQTFTFLAKNRISGRSRTSIIVRYHVETNIKIKNLLIEF